MISVYLLLDWGLKNGGIFFDPPRPSFAKEGAFRSTPSLLCQGGLHILTKPSLLRREGCNRPPVLKTASL